MFCLVFLLLVQLTVSVRVRLSTGEIEGTTFNATYSPYGNQSAIVFLGIPFVAPPIGDLRFKKPRPAIPWEVVLETKSYRAACMSEPLRTYRNGIGGPMSEDCLHLNVFTNRYCMENKNCAVMIMIHGGGLLFESAAAFKPEILINNFVGQGRNIVVVSVNYRLGIFGFGQLNGEHQDKNVALYDLLEGVKWVRREIHNFGGNKNRITLAGHSGGAGLTVILSNSPLLKGLIHQQIVMSIPFPNLSKQSNFKGTTKVAQIVECIPEVVGFEKLPKRQMRKALSCLRSKSAQELLDAQLYVLKNTTYHFGSPPIDGEFIVDYADRVFTSNSVYPINTLLGTTTAELRKTQFLTDEKYADRKDFLVRNMCEHIGYELYKDPEQFSSKCHNYYMEGINAQYLSDDMEFYSQAVLIADAHLSNHTDVFLYSYAYTGAGPAYQRKTNEPSPHHSEDLIYVFGTSRGPFTPKDYEIERVYSGVFANFVNYGNPSPSKKQPWVPYTHDITEHFLIDFDEDMKMPGMRKNYYTEAVKFWSTAGEKSFREHWAPSLDTFYITNLVAPIGSHLANKTMDFDKTFEQADKMFYERELFLEHLKLERRKGLEIDERKLSLDVTSREGINVILIILAGVLLVAVLYLTISRFFMRRPSRNGYELLT